MTSTKQILSLRKALQADLDRLRTFESEHRLLETQLEDIRRRANHLEWDALEEVWPTFAQSLESHFRFEETEIFPRFEGDQPGDRAYVDRLRKDHAHVRDRLDALRIEIQLHCVRAETVNQLLDELHDHAQREHERLYPWLTEAIG